MAQKFSYNPVSYSERVAHSGQKGLVVWFTGLSGAGKTTIAIGVERALFEQNKLVFRLDGDELRQGLNAGLGFSTDDRMENIRRAAHVARLLQQAGLIILASFISPHQTMRSMAREIIHPEFMLEIYVKASLETCIQRDPKGFYQKALAGTLNQYTGLSKDQNYEEPVNPDLVLDTDQLSLEECIQQTLMRIATHYEPS